MIFHEFVVMLVSQLALAESCYLIYMMCVACNSVPLWHTKSPDWFATDRALHDDVV